MDFNDNWYFYKESQEDKKIIVTLPYDAMIKEKRNISNPGGVNISYFAGGKYIYEKEFTLDSKPDSIVYFEFEGVYRKAHIYINDKEACYRSYGYTDFIFEATKYRNLNGKNRIKVTVDNSEQPNSRWYSGSGIFRPVSIYILPKNHIIPNSIKVTTLDYQKGLINIKAKLSDITSTKIDIFNYKNEIVYTEKIDSTANIDSNITLSNPELWSANNPRLYHLRITIPNEEENLEFGIRKITLDKEKGLLINGRRVILLGGCIHHDNGILGANTFEFSERRKVRLLKAAGYNALRMAHNPCSKALLKACDELGMYVLDEYVDCWYIHKTKYDYADEVSTNYQNDLKEMVDKDYSHPSVIMYSIGNEVSETESKKGAAFTKMLTDALHSLDSTRPVTCGVNISMNFMARLHLGVYSNKKASQGTKEKQRSIGSEHFNKLVNVFGAKMMEKIARTHLADVTTKESFSHLDIAGYNYGLSRYKHDLKKYPNRFVLGTETFCFEEGKFMALAKKNNRLVGDFVWAALDYLGEAGIGSWVSAKDKSIFTDKASWISAGSGRLDLLGDENREMAYSRTAWNQEVISMGVVSPLDYRLKHSPSAWKMSQALDSYSFEGEENHKTRVEIYSQANYIQLYQNGKLLTTRKKKNDNGFYSIKINYFPGTLKAVALGSDKKEISSYELKTAGKETILQAIAETDEIGKDGLSYIHLYITDSQGTIKPLEDASVKMDSLEGGQLLALGNACPFNKDGYSNSKTDTYYGKALAIIKPDSIGSIKASFSSSYGKAQVLVKVS